jgi:hypothetical protein
MRASGIAEDIPLLLNLLKAVKVAKDEVFVRKVWDLVRSTTVDLTREDALLAAVMDACVG